MRFDYSHVLDNRGEPRSWDVLLDEAREVAEFAEELGFDGFWIGEHHFDAEGSDQLPNPVLLHADLAARTKNMRLGIAAIGLPLWHPIRLAEDIAMLDHLSGGRVDVALSRGILKGEIVNLNPEADRADEEKSRAIFQEHLDILKQAWTAERFSHRGERYTIPWPETAWNSHAMDPFKDADGFLESLPIIPRPVQTPHPPLYAVSQQEDGIRLAAHQGMGFMTSHPAGKKLRRLNDAYNEEADRIGRPAHAFRVAPAARTVFVAETEKEARAMIAPGVNARFDLITRVRGLGAWLDIGEDPDDPALNAMEGYDLLMERDHLFVGTPDQVADRMVHLYEDEGWEHFMLGASQIPREAARRSMRLLAEEVLPRVLERTGQPRSAMPIPVAPQLQRG